jgi:hypothetical protein
METDSFDKSYNNPEHLSKRACFASGSPPSSPSPPSGRQANLGFLPIPLPASNQSQEVKNISLQASSMPQMKRPYKRKKGMTRAEQELAAGRHQVAKTTYVDEVITVTKPMENWPVPKDGKSCAYILDLTDSPVEYKDKHGNLLTMVSIIRNKVCLNLHYHFFFA